MIDIVKLKSLVRLSFITAMMIALAWCAPNASAQVSVPAPSPSPLLPPVSAAEADEEAAGTDAVSGPLIKDYKGVRIGMSADEAREKLGKPESKGEKQDFFLISDNEVVQVYYDKDGKVNAVVATYTGKSALPTAVAVLGEDVAAGADGRVYKLVRYPAVGYWVAYSRTAGDSPVVSVTMKKMRALPK